MSEIRISQNIIDKIVAKVIHYLPCGVVEDIRTGNAKITTSRSGKSVYIERNINYNACARGFVDFVGITRQKGGYRIYIHRFEDGGEPWEEEYFLPDKIQEW